MDAFQAELPQGGSFGCESVCDDSLRLDGLVAQQPLKQGWSGAVVPAALHHHVQHSLFVVDGTPEVHPFAAMLQTTSSRCHRGEGAGRLGFGFLAMCGPNLIIKQRMVS